MLSIQVTIDPQLKPMMQDISGVLANLRPLLADLGNVATLEVRAHFQQRDAEGNRQGWSPRHFWLNEGRAKTALTQVTSDGATVAIASAPIAHKLRGGTITPKRGKALAIPMREEAYVKGSPKAWDKQLFAVRKKGGRVFLVVRQGEALRIMYVLVPKVTQAADPRTLPNLDELAQRLGDRARRFLARKAKLTA